MDRLDELTTTFCGAIQQLSQTKKAKLLLDAVLTLIEDGQYGEEVEKFLDLYLITSGVPKEDLAKAFLARGNVQRLRGERLFVNAQQDLRAVQLDPLISQPRKQIRFAIDPACERAPPEIWELIAAHTPRYHLRTWLFVSRFHRDIASRHIFHAIDIYFYEKNEHDLNRGLNILYRAMTDPLFAGRVKSLRLHWLFDDSDTTLWHLLIRILKTSLASFTALRNFEWIGYPGIDGGIVQALVQTHKHIHGLGILGSPSDTHGISAFDNLHKFALSEKFVDPVSKVDMGEVRSVLDRNEHTLKHVIFGGGQDPWDLAFASVTIDNLTHLDLVDAYISHFVLSRIASFHNLQSLTLHGWIVNLDSASAVFASDRLIDGTHTLFPHLEAFRLVLENSCQALYSSVALFLRKRERLRRLDLGSCPWDKVKDTLPDLKNLRVLGVRIKSVSKKTITSLVQSIPAQMAAIRLLVYDSAGPLNEYASYFAHFKTLSYLHLSSELLPYPTQTKEISAHGIAAAVPWLDLLAWCGQPYVVVNSHGGAACVEIKELPTRSFHYGRGVDLGDEDAAWLEKKDIPLEYQVPESKW